MSAPDLQAALPPVRGQYRFNARLAPTNWFQVGGAADVLFKPADTEDLQLFLQKLSPEISLLALGVGSNVIVRDGGVSGVVIRLGRGFTAMALEGDLIVAGAGALDVNVAQFAAQSSRTGIAFLAGIPGTIGGALAMNAGAYGTEMADILESCEAIDRQGNLHRLNVDECHYRYRHFGGDAGLIFTRAWLRTKPGNQADIMQQMAQITKQRAETQPIRARTGGSTFANPTGQKAWELIDAAGCRGLQIGQAQISPKHCNFMINLGGASAHDLESLGEMVRKRVQMHSNVALSWEIRRIGRAHK
jgi:UDP-N-acetylmuramate dehydrogenase